MKIFLEEAGILEMYANITFKEYKKVLQYDLKDVLENLEINQN